MKILYMGTPDFALPTLQTLIYSEHEIVGVVTQPDRPKGRRQEIQTSPVKQIALREELKIFQPEKTSEDKFIKEIRRLQADLIIVAAYGQILNQEILDLPKFFCMNLHASLLPKYRGAAPINWAIINGDHQTGITTMKMNASLDTGDMLLKQVVDINDSDNNQTLHDKLAQVGAELVLKTIDTLIEDRLVFNPQDSEEATYAPKLQKTDGFICWDQDAQSIHNLVRGLTPSPGTYTFFKGKRFVISKTDITSGVVNQPAGTIVRVSDHGLEISTGKGRLIITELKPEGKRSMPVKNFIQGNPIEVGATFDPWPTNKFIT